MENEEEDTRERFAALAKALIAARKEINHPVRNKINPHFRNRYADLTAVLDSVIPVFLKHGLAVVQTLQGEDLVTLLIHESGASISSAAKIPAGKPGPQALGSALTYMRRYTLQALASIAAEDDDDAEAAQPKKAAPQRTTDDNEDW